MMSLLSNKERVMNYRELKQILNSMTESELDQTATVYVNEEDEFYAVNSVRISDESCDQLDPEHLYLSV